jgi:hypothetical protein
MSDKINDLLGMKEKVDDLKIKLAKMEGKTEELEKYFIKEFGVSDLEKISKKVDEGLEEIRKMKEEFDKEVEKLKEKFYQED